MRATLLQDKRVTMTKRDKRDKRGIKEIPTELKMTLERNPGVSLGNVRDEIERGVVITVRYDRVRILVISLTEQICS